MFIGNNPDIVTHYHVITLLDHMVDIISYLTVYIDHVYRKSVHLYFCWVQSLNSKTYC